VRNERAMRRAQILRGSRKKLVSVHDARCSVFVFSSVDPRSASRATEKQKWTRSKNGFETFRGGKLIILKQKGLVSAISEEKRVRTNSCHSGCPMRGERNSELKSVHSRRRSDMLWFWKDSLRAERTRAEHDHR